MDIKSTLAHRAYSETFAPKPQTKESKEADFTQIAQSFAETVQRGEAQAKAALTTQADPHALVTALAETKLAVDTAVTVRDKVVEAYQEILRMQV